MYAACSMLPAITAYLWMRISSTALLLREMYRVLKNEGYDCCAGFREDREGEGRVRSFLSRGFYKIVNKICDMNMSDGAGDYRMMNRAMADSILEFKEYNRYMKGIFSFIGFDTKWIPFRNVERAAGNSKWSFRSLFRYALDGIFSFSTAPITLAGTIGQPPAGCRPAARNYRGCTNVYLRLCGQAESCL